VQILFGLTAEEVMDLKSRGYQPLDFYSSVRTVAISYSENSK
jgi:hypothetical protein